MTSEEDTRRRPLVFRTQAEPVAGYLRRPARVLTWATLVLVALVGAAGVALGGSAVWSGVGPDLPNTPAPLWPLPPTPITPTNQPALAGNSAPSTDNPATHANPPAPATTDDRQRGKGTSDDGGKSADG